MGAAAGPNIVEDGLVLCLDAANERSYPGSGSSLLDISNNGVTATLNGSYQYSSEGIRIFNSSTDKSSNTSHIQLSALESITTVSLWYKLESTNATRYLLDIRSGGTGGWIYNISVGSNWDGGTMYLNSVIVGDPQVNENVAVTDDVGLWRNIVVIANTPATDDMNIFSRFSDDEGLDVTFGAASVYNRTLTEAEIKQNFNALRGRYGI